MNSKPEKVLDTTSQPQLRLTRVIYTTDGTPYTIGGFLVVSGQEPKQILMCTAGDVEEGTQFFTDKSANAFGYLGQADFLYNGVIVIKLVDYARDEVSNLLFSDTGQPCALTVYKGNARELRHQRAWYHRSCGRATVTIDFVMETDSNDYNLFFGLGNNGVFRGSTVTSIPDQVNTGNSCLLQAYGVVYRAVESMGRQYVKVTMLWPVIQYLQANHFRGEELSFLVPILPTESGDTPELTPSGSGPSPSGSATSWSSQPSTSVDSGVVSPGAGRSDSQASSFGGSVARSQSQASISSAGDAAAAAASTAGGSGRAAEELNTSSDGPDSALLD